MVRSTLFHVMISWGQLCFCFNQGVMAGFDQKSNVVLSDSKERVYSMDEGVEEIPLGLYLVKGDMMSVYFLNLHVRADIDVRILVC